MLLLERLKHWHIKKNRPHFTQLLKKNADERWNTPSFFVRNDGASERRARFPPVPAVVPLIKACGTHSAVYQGWNRKLTRLSEEPFGLSLCLWSIGCGAMDVRLFVPVVLLSFGLATVFAQTSAPGQGRNQPRKFCLWWRLEELMAVWAMFLVTRVTY